MQSAAKANSADIEANSNTSDNQVKPGYISSAYTTDEMRITDNSFDKDYVMVDRINDHENIALSEETGLAGEVISRTLTLSPLSL